MIRRTIMSLTTVGLVGLVGGCNMNKPTLGSPRTEGERTILEGKLQMEKGRLMVEGEEIVAKGQGQKARGEALRKQGKVVQGDRLVRDAEIMIGEGRTKIEQAKSMNTEVVPTTRQTR